MNKVWTEEDEREFRRLGRKRLAAKGPRSAYDMGADLASGEEGERMLVEAFGNCEVKRMFEASRWGQAYIEHENYGKPSGIATTEADFWFLVLDGPEYNGEVIIGIKTDRLKDLIAGVPVSIPVGQDRASRGKRPWLTELILPLRRVK